MLAITFSDITTTGAIGAIVVVFVILGFAKGLVRMTFGFVALAAGILAGLWGFKNGASIAGMVLTDPDPWMSAAVGVILGLAIFFVARALFGVLLSPVGAKDGKAKNLAAPGGLLGFLMGAAFAWFCFSGVRYIGTLSELDWVRGAVNDKEWISAVGEDEEAKRPPQPFFSKLKRGLDASALGKLHEKFDFLNNRAHANLAKLNIVIATTESITTTTENKADKALLAAYSRFLARAYQVKSVETAALEPKINELLTDNKKKESLKAFYENGQFSQLLHSTLLKDVCALDGAHEMLAKLDIEKAIGLIVDDPDEEEE